MSIHHYFTNKSNVQVDPEVKKTLGKIVERTQPQMYQGVVGPLDCSQEDIEQIIYEIYQTDRVSKKKCCIFFAKTINYGNTKYGWDVPEIEDVFPSVLERNQVTLETLVDVNKFRVMEQNYIKSLEEDTPDSFNERVSQVLSSLIFYDGLLTKRMVMALLRCLRDGLFVHGNLLWAALSDLGDEDGDRKPRHSWLRFRRLHVDPLSALLIVRWLKNYPQDIENLHKFDIKDFVKNYCRSLAGDTIKIHSLSTILRLAKSRHLLYFPTFLSAYASGGLHCTSLSQQDFFRVFEDACLVENEPEEIAESGDKKYQTFQIVPQETKSASTKIQLSLLEDLLQRDDFKKLKFTKMRTLSENERKIYRDEAKKILKNHLDTHHDTLSQAHTLLIKWALQLLEKAEDPRERRKTNSPLAVSSVYTYLSKMGKALLEAAEDKDLLALKPLNLELVYEEAIGSKKSSGSRADTAGNLYQFHGYLEYFEDKEELDFDEIRVNFGLKVRNVKAKIITMTTYHYVLKRFGWGQKNLHRRNVIQIIILILSFKCGLRYGEIVTLRTWDYQYGPSPVLLIRNHRYHNNKTEKARRLIPLKKLLDEQEFEFVKSFFEYRLKEFDYMSNQLLFGELTQKGGVVHCGELVQPIVDAIRLVTGDNKLSFHSLRHSFATWFVVRLMLREDIKTGHSFKSLKDDLFSSQTTWKLKKDLFKNRPLGSIYLKGLSIFIGHGDPLTTLHHYCHLTDWLLGYYSRHPYCMPNLSLKAIQKIADVDLDRASEIKSNSTLVETANRNIRSNQHLFKRLNFDTEIPETKNLIVKRSHHLRTWEDVFREVIKHHEESKEQHEDEASIAIPENKYELYLACELYQNAYALNYKKTLKIKKILLSDQLSYSDKDSLFSLHDRRYAKKVSKALKLLGIEDKQILLFYDQNQINGSSLTDLTEYLNVSPKSFQPKSVNFRKQSSGAEYLALRIRKCNEKFNDKLTNKHNNGFNFFVRLLEFGFVR